MGYFDALIGSAFKTTDDGRRFFYPWGILGRGYAIGSDEEFRRLRRGLRVYYIVSLPLAIAAVVWGGFLVGVSILPILIIPYVVWARIQTRRLAQTNERLTLRESLTNQARTHSMVVLWSLEIGSLLFVLVGLLILVVDPGSWLIALGNIIFFAFCALAFARMLVVKRRGGGAVGS